MIRVPRLLAALLVAVPAAAQDLTPKAPPQQKPIAIRGAVIHTVSGGSILGGTIWFQDGVIRGVRGPGEDAALPPGTEVIDGAGRHVYPGLISAHTSLGLQEISSVRPSVDLRETGELTPEAMAAVAINPDSAALPVTRSNGVLVAGVFPQGGLVPGRAAVIQLDGWTNEDLAVSADAGLVVQWPARIEDRPWMRRRPPAETRAPGGEGDAEDRTAQNRKRIDELFAAAGAWADAAAADPTTPRDLRYAAMARAVRAQAPTFVLAEELEQIESAVAWAIRRGLKPVIVGGRDAGLCAALLVRHGVPVVLGGTHPLPSRSDSPFSERFELPALLHAAGVRFCLASGESFYNERNLPYQAATAIAWGLDRQVALASVTLRAAEILGVGARLGSLETGKDATLLLTDGSPLDLNTGIEAAFVRGRRIDLRNKQTELARKYREKYEQPSNGR
jgi:imidazolonepropionase-like amidohydrolase